MVGPVLDDGDVSVDVTGDKAGSIVGAHTNSEITTFMFFVVAKPSISLHVKMMKYSLAFF